MVFLHRQFLVRLLPSALLFFMPLFCLMSRLCFWSAPICSYTSLFRPSSSIFFSNMQSSQFSCFPSHWTVEYVRFAIFQLLSLGPVPYFSVRNHHILRFLQSDRIFKLRKQSFSCVWFGHLCGSFQFCLLCQVSKLQRRIFMTVSSSSS